MANGEALIFSPGADIKYCSM